MITINDLLKRAEELSRENVEIAWRESVKTAYYYVYHSVNKLLNKHNIDLMQRGYGEHQFLIERVKSIESQTAKSLARDLQILKDRRAKCCYKLDDTITQLVARSHIKSCQQAIEKLSKLDKEI